VRSLKVNYPRTCNVLIIPRICEMYFGVTHVLLYIFLARCCGKFKHISNKGIRDMDKGMPIMSYL
jgi:hypothetical protein